MSEISRPDRFGRRVVRWYDSSGKRCYATLDPMPIVQARRELAARLAGLVPERVETVTVLHVAKSYLEHRKSSLTPLGFDRARGIVTNHIKMDPIGTVTASAVRPVDARSWQDRRKAQGASDATLDRERALLIAILNNAVESGLIESHRLGPRTLKRLVSATDGKTVFFERDEWNRFITALDNESGWTAWVEQNRKYGPSRIDTKRSYGAGRRGDSEATRDYRLRLLAFRPVFEALLDTASRLSEVRLLAWDQIDLRGGFVRIEQGKTKRVNVVPLSDRMRIDLESRPRGISKTYVYAQANGDPYTKQQIERAFATYRNVAGLRRELTIHTIRHTAASWMLDEGRTIQEVREILGHASISTTGRYVHAQPRHLRDAVRTLEAK